MRSQEFTGKTTQEAIDAGLAAFGVTIADVHVDVLQEGAKGLFGLFGSKPALVRLTVMEEEKEDDHGLSDLLGSFSLNEPALQRKKKPAAPKAEAKAEVKAEAKPEAKTEKKAEEPKKAEPKPEKKAEPEKKPEPKAEPKKEEKPEVKAEAAAEQEAKPEKKERKPRQKKAPKADAPKAEKKSEEHAEKKDYQPMEPAKIFSPTEPPVIHPEDTIAGCAQRFLMEVTDRMGVKVEVYVDDSNEDNLYIHMVGDTLGILIGRRGETLDALQYLTSLQVNKGRDGYIRVTLDTENYRAKREDSLRRLAQRMANRAQKTGRKVVLEPMNPYERRVLHTALQNHPAVTTHSEGEEPNRRVVIMLAGQQPQGEKAERSEKNEKGEKGERKSSSRRSRSRRRGRRGPKPEAQGNAQEPVIESAEANTIDVLGGEE